MESVTYQVHQYFDLNDLYMMGVVFRSSFC